MTCCLTCLNTGDCAGQQLVLPGCMLASLAASRNQVELAVVHCLGLLSPEIAVALSVFVSLKLVCLVPARSGSGFVEPALAADRLSQAFLAGFAKRVLRMVQDTAWGRAWLL